MSTAHNSNTRQLVVPGPATITDVGRTAQWRPSQNRESVAPKRISIKTGSVGANPADRISWRSQGTKSGEPGVRLSNALPQGQRERDCRKLTMRSTTNLQMAAGNMIDPNAQLTKGRRDLKICIKGWKEGFVTVEQECFDIAEDGVIRWPLSSTVGSKPYAIIPIGKSVVKSIANDLYNKNTLQHFVGAILS